MSKIIFVDFDGTICPNKGAEEYPPPSPECIETLTALQANGHTIMMYSVRSNLRETNKKNGHVEMIEYLDRYNIPYDGIDTSKPHFSVIIDDKGLGVPLDNNKNVQWEKVKTLLTDKRYI